MKKIIIIFASIILNFGVPAAFANIEVAAYKPSLSSGHYEGKVAEVVLAVRRDESGKVISQKHDILYVKVAANKNNSLMLRFESDDFQTGLALMNTIGKKISLFLDKNENKDFIARDIKIMQP